jgi:hypothetical protein
VSADGEVPVGIQHNVYRSCLYSVLGAVSVAGLVACGTSPSDADVRGVAATDTPVAATETPLPFCPSLEQLEQHWEKYEQELKLPCPDPDPLPEPSNKEPSGLPVEAPTTLAEAQELYDPDNDPLILIGRDDDGTYVSVTIAVLDSAFIPPASIKTTAQYEQWAAQRPKNSR